MSAALQPNDALAGGRIAFTPETAVPPFVIPAEAGTHILERMQFCCKACQYGFPPARE